MDQETPKLKPTKTMTGTLFHSSTDVVKGTSNWTQFKFKIKPRGLTFMGHKVTEHGLVPDDSKVSAIKNMPNPQDKKGVQRFLGMCNFLGQYIPRLSEICSPLREIAAPSAEFSWSSTQQCIWRTKAENFWCIGNAIFWFRISSRPTSWCLRLWSGAALIQNNKIVAFSSSTLSETERNNYAQIEKECLAIVHGMHRWDLWLYGHPNIIVESDHKPLQKWCWSCKGIISLLNTG